MRPNLCRTFRPDRLTGAARRCFRAGVVSPAMKRRVEGEARQPKAKKARAKVPDYHSTPSLRDEDGEIIWPAPKVEMETAREVIRECARKNEKTLIVPDKDADGLSSGVILIKTLRLLGLEEENVIVHLLQKGETVHSESERTKMQSHSPSYIFVLDQGTASAPPLIDNPHTGLIIDHHHYSDATSDFPQGALFVNACNSPPVATSSLLTYELCKPLHDAVADECAWLCALGTHGDLGNTLKWEAPFPDMAATFKQHPKSTITSAISLLNAPRRTAAYDVPTAWAALSAASTPRALLTHPRLLAARAEVAAEVERCTHTPPRFTHDASVAVLRVSSQAQVHPLIATRWANHLASPRLRFVLVANDAHRPDAISFSCRVARVARARGEDVDIIAALKNYARLHDSGTLLERLGESFARGHVQASGGIVGKDEFEELMGVMRVGEKPEAKSPSKAKGKGGGGEGQRNTLMSYFGKG